METQNTNSKQIQKKETFTEWQERVSSQINEVLNNPISKDFLQTHKENFLLDEIGENNYEKREDVENNFLYNIPNIAVALYQESGEEINDLILSILKIYQTQTGLKFLGINWLNKSQLPIKFISYTKTKKLDPKFILYLLGKSFTFKKYIKQKDNDKKEEVLGIYRGKLNIFFQKSSLFRKGIEDKIETILKINEIEYLRKLVNSSLNNIGNIKTISDKDWIDFLHIEGEKELKKLKKEKTEIQKKLKLKTTKEEIDELQKELDDINFKISKTKSDILLGEKINDLSNETKSIIDDLESENFKKELENKKRINDNLAISHLEEEAVQKIMKELSRYHIEKNEDDREASIPKNFLNDKSLTCFSGAWTISALLLKMGFEKENIFIVNSFFGRKYYNHYNHSFVILKKSNGEFLKIDYGFSEVKILEGDDIEDFEKEYMFLLNLGNNNVKYSNHNQDIHGLDEKGKIYKLTDGIVLMYLLNLTHTLIEKNDLEKALYYLNIASGIDKDNPDLNEALGMVYDKLGDKEKSYTFFKKSNTLLSHYMIGKYEFENKNFEKAYGRLDYFIIMGKKSRGVKDELLISATKLLDEVKEILSTENKKDDEIENLEIKGFEYCKSFLINLFKLYHKRKSMKKYKDELKNYLKLNEIDRKNILYMLNNFAKNDKGNTWSIEILLNLIQEEGINETKLYKRLNIDEFNLKI